jgi:hypothetical protein
VLSPVNTFSIYTDPPFGSDMFPPWSGTPPAYPDFRPNEPHPWLPAGMNSTVVSGDELNGGGINWDREVWVWDDIRLSRPTLMAATGNTDPNVPSVDGQTVDLWVARERRDVFVPRDPRKVRANGRRGHLDERHPR